MLNIHYKEFSLLFLSSYLKFELKKKKENFDLNFPEIFEF